MILVYWVVAAFLLLSRDVIPDFSWGFNPNLRTIAAAGRNDPPVKWTIHVVDAPRNSSESRRKVGEAVTGSTVRDDGWSTLASQVFLDSTDLFKGTPLAAIALGRLRVESHYLVDPKGDLHSLELKITADEAPDFPITVKGKVVDGPLDGTGQRQLELVFKGRDIEQTRRFPYEPKSMVGNLFGPMDRLPGLHVGQRWETSMVNPISGQVDRVRVEVPRRSLIHWGNEPVSTFEVVQSVPPFASARSWVRTDGVVLRQELPFPVVRLVLERQPDAPSQTRAISP